MFLGKKDAYICIKEYTSNHAASSSKGIPIKNVMLFTRYPLSIAFSVKSIIIIKQIGRHMGKNNTVEMPSLIIYLMASITTRSRSITTAHQVSAFLL
jgi:hypothetical protein